MEKEMFQMKIIERRSVDGNFRTRKFNYNRRKSDKLEDNNLYKIKDSVYMLNGVLFTDSFEIISTNTKKNDYMNVEYNRFESDEKNYIIQNGSFVVVLNSLDIFEDPSFDKEKLDEIISNIDARKLEMFLYNGSWWVKKENNLIDVEYKRIMEEDVFLDDLKEIPIK